jgi:hypothetical protein
MSIKNYIKSYIETQRLNEGILCPSRFAKHIMNYYYKKGETMLNTMAKLINGENEEDDELTKKSIDFSLHFILLYGINKIHKKNKVETEKEYKKTTTDVIELIIEKWSLLNDLVNCNEDPNSVIDIFTSMKF